MSGQPPMAMQPNPGYPPAGYEGGMPQPDQSQGYPQAGSYPPGAGSHPPQQGYPPPQQGYPPPQGQQQPPAIQQQPGGQAQPGGWMAVPDATSCPKGLEYLTQIDQLLIHQQVELLEAFTGFETNNRYEVKNTMGQRVYFVAEDTHCLARTFCGNERPFDIKIMDNSGCEVIHLESPLRCDSCWFPCCLKEVTITSQGTTLGYVRQAWSILKPKFYICDATNDRVLTIEGPCFTCNMCGDVEFDVMSNDGRHKVGQITKQWTGFAKEMFTDADNFGISFPMDLDCKIKAVLLGAVFLIDFMFFEKEQNKEQHTATML